ncbi:lymphocyte antigen 6D-like [Bufo bufo]|uniref:lymphocyte antigen 6D-like n=1 Tax=Bufo bufo TaxID=8384 RepID=UPI001ABE41AF|nr:lymphocyte antigen 6D-like [Bufo bufo]
MMRNYIALTLCIYLIIPTGDALKCYSCSDVCPSLSEVNCSKDETCYSIKTHFGERLARFKGCLSKEKCNTTVGSAVRQCCDTDLCNTGTVPGVFSMVSIWLGFLISLRLYCF